MQQVADNRLGITSHPLPPAPTHFFSARVHLIPLFVPAATWFSPSPSTRPTSPPASASSLATKRLKLRGPSAAACTPACPQSPSPSLRRRHRCRRYETSAVSNEGIDQVGAPADTRGGKRTWNPLHACTRCSTRLQRPWPRQLRYALLRCAAAVHFPRRLALCAGLLFLTCGTRRARRLGRRCRGQLLANAWPWRRTGKQEQAMRRRAAADAGGDVELKSAALFILQTIKEPNCVMNAKH
jgi:hypothetical protein